MGKKAFVTGGTGFIGSHLVERLRAEGYAEIRCLVRQDPKWLADIPGLTLIRGSLFDREALTRGVEGVDEVFHLAGVTRAPSEDLLFRGNVEATVHLLEVIEAVHPRLRRILITSSLAAVGPSPDGQPLTEEAPLRPISAYGRSKAEMERRVQPFMGRLPITIVRPPAVYGPRERDIYTYFRVARTGLLPMLGRGSRPRLNLVHVHDLVEGMLLAIAAPEAEGQTYFIGSECHYSWEDLRHALEEALARRLLPLVVPEPAVYLLAALTEGVGRLLGTYPAFNREKAREMTAAWLCSVEKARRDLGYRQTVSLVEGLRSTLTWYRQAGWL